MNEFTVPGRPVAWQRVKTNHFGRSFKPKRTREHEELIAWYSRAQSFTFGDSEVTIELEFHAKRKLTGDLDNYTKCVLDGLQIGGMIENDRQVRSILARFGESDEDKTVIQIRPLLMPQSEGREKIPGRRS
jgi:Holliday junction resolvase RusA-like endonuclease